MKPVALLLPARIAERHREELEEIGERMPTMELRDSEVEGYFHLAGNFPEKCPECRVRLKYFYLDDKWVCPECGYFQEKEAV